MLSQNPQKENILLSLLLQWTKFAGATEKTLVSNIEKLNGGKNVPEIIARAVAQSAEVVGAKAIITFTITGNTAQTISKFRTKVRYSQ